MRDSPLRPFREVFTHTNYRNYCAGRLALISAIWMERIGYGWLAWELTGSEIWLGTLAACEMLVSLLVVPIAGALADRIDPLGLLKRCHLLSILWSALFFIFILSGLINIYLLMILVIAKAISSAFSQPVGMSMVNNLIARNRNHLGPAISINSTVFHLGRIIGPALAGFVIAGFGVATVFAVGILGYAAFVITLHWHVHLEVNVRPTTRSPILEDIAAGLRYACNHPGLTQVFLLGIAASFLLRPYPDLLPSIAEVMFNRGADGLALLAGASGAGGLVGSVYVLFQQGRKHLLKATANIALLTAFFLFAFAQSELLLFGAFFIALMAASDVVMAVNLQILVQTKVEDEYRGRCISLLAMLVRIGPPTGAFLVGWLTTLLPIHVGLSLSAAAGLLAIGTLRVSTIRS